LVVELDGEIHQLQKEYDEARTKHLEAYGYKVVRFRNEEVLTDLASVLETIREAAEE
jgi:very-short-patch-repair endonuclease